MTKDEWHKKYKETILKYCRDADEKFAEETLQAGMDNHDYDQDPEDAALEEMSYWTD
jgi:hypothetical protein